MIKKKFFFLNSMSYNSIYKKWQFVLQIVYANITYCFYFILFILSKQSSRRTNNNNNNNLPAPNSTLKVHSISFCLYKTYQLRFYYSKYAVKPNEKPRQKMNPWFIVGFVDGEGCFSVNVVKNKKMKTGWRVKQSFSIDLHNRNLVPPPSAALFPSPRQRRGEKGVFEGEGEPCPKAWTSPAPGLVILEDIQKYFCVGNIYMKNKDYLSYLVTSIEDLKVIREHFEKYPLLTKKRADFELWAQILNLIYNKEHLTIEGLTKIVATKASLNKTINEELKAEFPNVIPVTKPFVNQNKIKDPNWLAGFTTGEGYFLISIFKSNTVTGFVVRLRFKLTLHSRDTQLMKSLVDYLGCGRYVEGRSGYNYGEFIVSNLSDLTKIVIPFFFYNNPIKGNKALDYYDFCKAALIMVNKGHLTSEGLHQIRLMKSGMNRARQTSILIPTTSHRDLTVHPKKNGSNYISQKRFFSTSTCSWVNKIKGNSNKSSRKTLKSPQARVYKDLYKGRGRPPFEPEWVKDNGKERSPFGASWAKSEKDRLPFPYKYPLNYKNIKDPYNNRKFIKEICRGNRVVYIFTFIPTGICLVGSSSNSVERVLSYFEKKYLFLDFRRGVKFLSDYGFENIQLTIIYLDNQKFTMRDIKILEAYYIKELNSSLNSQKYVYLPEEPLESVLPFINISNRDTAIPIFVYGPDLSRVLYIFSSKTSLYNDFGIHPVTVNRFLNNLKFKQYDYFAFSTKILEGSDLDNLLSLNELIILKDSVNPKKPNRVNPIILKNRVHNIEISFYSLRQAAFYIENIEGVCDLGTLRKHMKKNTLYKKKWEVIKA